MIKEKLINWICNDYITNIKHNNWEEEDWYYLIEKAFNLNNMSLEELKNFKKELTEQIETPRKGCLLLDATLMRSETKRKEKNDSRKTG